MTKRLFVGSLPYSIDDAGLKGLFETIGKVIYARVIRHKDTKLSRGFGFVEMSTEAEAEAALQGMLDKTYDGRKIVVTEAWDGQNPGGEL